MYSIFKKATILVVDDTPQNLDILIDALQAYGSDVRIAKSGKKAIEIAKRVKPHMILLDVIMPEIDGIEVCKELKKHNETKQIPVIFLSALSDTVDEVKGIELGAVDYISKPIVLEKVIVRIRTHLQLYGLQNELASMNSHLEEKVKERTIKLEEEIENHKQTEYNLRQTLNEKNELLKEVHDRVRNNMQLLLSLLELQVATITDDSFKKLVIDYQSRIRSIALVQKVLHDSDSYTSINMRKYIDLLLPHYTHSIQKKSADILYDISVHELYLPLEQAVPCGLILNEIITNSLNHAFKNGEDAKITISMKKDQDNFLSISDNGQGLPAHIDMQNIETLGLQLIHSLVKQLNGTIDIETEYGTKYIIYFPEAKHI